MGFTHFLYYLLSLQAPSNFLFGKLKSTRLKKRAGNDSLQLILVNGNSVSDFHAFFNATKYPQKRFLTELKNK